MIQADSVHSTPPTDAPIDTTRRRFLATAAVGSFVGAGSLAAAAMTPPNVPQAVTIPPAACLAVPAVLSDPVFALIADKRAADIAHGQAIDAEEAKEHGIGLDEASDRSLAAYHAVNAIDWKLATTPPTTLAGVAAVLRFANEIEDGGMEWPDTDAIGARAGITSCGRPWRRRSRRSFARWGFEPCPTTSSRSPSRPAFSPSGGPFRSPANQRKRNPRRVTGDRVKMSAMDRACTRSCSAAMT